jgi:uncharacterized protein (TIGR03083 family)
MDRHQIVTELTAERLDLCDFLEHLEPNDWTTTSLCAGWTVHDVVAHLALNTEVTTLGFIGGIIRYGGNFDRKELDEARAESAKSTPQALTARLRHNAGSPQRAPGSARIDPLLDVIIHGQDISRAVGRPRPILSIRGVPALEHAVTSRFYGARKRFDGIRLSATDTDWRHGTGPLELRGTIADLLLVSTGRAAALTTMTGDGLPTVAERLNATAKPT